MEELVSLALQAIAVSIVLLWIVDVDAFSFGDFHRKWQSEFMIVCLVLNLLQGLTIPVLPWGYNFSVSSSNI